MFASVANLFRIPELRNRIFFTITMLCLYRVGWNIPIPGIDPGKIRELADKATGDTGPKKLVKMKITLDAIKRGGRLILFKHKGKGKRIKISGRRTKVYIKGQMEDRSNLKPGMKCEVTVPEKGREAKKVSCK